MIPILLLALLSIAFLVLGWARQIYPERRLVVLALLSALLAFGLIASARVEPVLIAVDLAILLAAGFDLATLPRPAAFTCAREMGRIASLNKPHGVKLLIDSRAGRALDVVLRDDVPDECLATPDEFSLRLPNRSRTMVNYTLAPKRRGAFRFEAVFLRVTSRLKLWQRTLKYDVAQELHVYPDMHQMLEYAVLARTDRLSLLGVRRTRRIGQDNEFERLRDYTPDDNYKHIEWRSTARRGKLTVKDFQANQSQRVLFLVDCGRMMTGTWGGLSMLDHAFNAVLMLSYVALNRGDAVGWLSFADEVERYVPPRSGMNQMNRLLHASFDRFPRMVESRYDQAFLYLNARCRKRSLVILITNLIDDVNARQVGSYLTRLVGRHLPLAVFVRDHAIFDAAQPIAGNEASLFRAAAATDIIQWRAKVLADLAGQGVLSLDVFPEQMTAPLVNRYLEVKARHLL